LKYDDASWHSGGKYPEDLSDEAAATHSGMFLAWALLADLGGRLHLDDFTAEYQRLGARQITPGRYFLATCDGKLTDQEFNDEGNRFASEYYDLDSGRYLTDYADTFGDDLPSLYHVPDSWSSFDKMKDLLDQRFKEWQGGN